jgi:thiol-disulfide isomerase/thioredoxin
MRSIFALFFAAVLVAVAQSETPDAEQEHLRSVLSQSTNTPQDVTRALEQHLAKFPKSAKLPEIERALAKAAIEAKDEYRIALYGERVLAREPEDLQMLDQVCRALVHSGARADSERALEYARRYEKVLAANGIDKEASGADQARQREVLDNAMGRALILQAEAQANLGQIEQAVALAGRAYDFYPGAAPAGERGKWLVQLGRFGDAVQAYADALTVPDAKVTDAERAAYRRLLGDTYQKWKGSEAGLGDIVLQAYDRNLATSADRRLALKKFDPNLGLTDPMQFTLTGISGDKLNLSSLQGKVVVMDFWATWCGPCRAQYPLYEEVKKKFEGNPNVVFLAVSTDEERDLVKPFLDAQKWNKRVYFEDGLSRTLRVTSIPTTVVIDRHGRLSSRMNGYDPERFVSMLTARIEEALD